MQENAKVTLDGCHLLFDVSKKKNCNLFKFETMLMERGKCFEESLREGKVVKEKIGGSNSFFTSYSS